MSQHSANCRQQPANSGLCRVNLVLQFSNILFTTHTHTHKTAPYASVLTSSISPSLFLFFSFSLVFPPDRGFFTISLCSLCARVYRHECVGERRRIVEIIHHTSPEFPEERTTLRTTYGNGASRRREFPSSTSLLLLRRLSASTSLSSVVVVVVVRFDDDDDDDDAAPKTRSVCVCVVWWGVFRRSRTRFALAAARALCTLTKFGEEKKTTHTTLLLLRVRGKTRTNARDNRAWQGKYTNVHKHTNTQHKRSRSVRALSHF